MPPTQWYIPELTYGYNPGVQFYSRPFLPTSHGPPSGVIKQASKQMLSEPFLLSLFPFPGSFHCLSALHTCVCEWTVPGLDPDILQRAKAKESSHLPQSSCPNSESELRMLIIRWQCGSI